MRRMWRRNSWMVLAGLVLTLLLGCGAPAATPAATQPPAGKPQAPAVAKPEVATVAVAASNEPQFGSAVRLAAEKKYFADYGLNVDLQIFATGAAQKEPLVAGQIPIGLVGSQVWLTMRSAGAPISVISRASDLGDTIHLVATDKIKVPKDFEGKKVGYLKGSILEGLFLAFAKEYGVDLKKVELIHMSQPDMVTSIATGRLDAVVTAGPVGPQAVEAAKQYGARLLHTALTSHLSGKPEPKKLIGASSIYVANDDFLKKNPNATVAFLRGIAKANEVITKTPDEVAPLIAQKIDLPVDIVKDTWKRSKYHMVVDQSLVDDDIKGDNAFLMSVGAISGSVDVDKGMNVEALRQAFPDWVTWKPKP